MSTASTGIPSGTSSGSRSDEMKPEGNAQRVGEGAPVMEDPVYRSSSGVHGDQNTLDDRTGVFNPSGHRSGERKR